jgi:tetratricopeptide (TPR) repeat protein
VEQRGQEAIGDLRLAARLRPQDTAALRLLAEALVEAPGHGPEALDVLDRLLRLDPDDRTAILNRGRIVLSLGDFQRAEADFSRALGMQPDDPDTLYQRARARHRLGRDREALADLDRLIAGSPSMAAAYHLRGKVREALGELGAAQADFRRTSDALPQDAGLLNNQAWLLVAGPEATRDADRAYLLISRAVELKPGQMESLNTKGLVLYRLGRHAEAIDALEESLRAGQSLRAGRGQSDAYDLFMLAMAHARLGHTTEGCSCYERALQWWRGRKGLSSMAVRELSVFRAEAAAALSIADLPDDPFAPRP